MEQKTREVFQGCDSKDEQTVLHVPIIYRCGDVCYQFGVGPRKKRAVRNPAPW